MFFTKAREWPWQPKCKKKEQLNEWVTTNEPEREITILGGIGKRILHFTNPMKE